MDRTITGKKWGCEKSLLKKNVFKQKPGDVLLFVVK